MEIGFKLLVPILLIICSCSNRANVAKTQATENNHCVELFKEYKYYWINDSTGKNGFRELLASKHLNNCKLVGLLWKTISEYLGNANDTFIKDSTIHYRYRLNNSKDESVGPGSMFLEVFIENGIIVIFKVDTMDG